MMQFGVKASSVNADWIGGMQIGERIFCRAKQKTQANLGGLTSIFVSSGGKYTAEVRANDSIGVYINKRAGENPLSVNIFIVLG